MSTTLNNEPWRTQLSELQIKISLAQQQLMGTSEANQDPTPLTNILKELGQFYLSVSEKDPEFSFQVSSMFEMIANSKVTNNVLFEKETAKIYIDALSHPTYGALLSGRGGIWKLVSVVQQLSNAHRPKDFVECGYLQLMNDMKASIQDPTNTAYTTTIMSVYHTIGNEKEYAHLTVEAMASLIKKLDSNSFEARNYLNYFYNVVMCDRERIFAEFAELLEEIKKKFEGSKNQAIRKVLFNLFGTKNAEYVSLLIDYAGTKKKHSFPIMQDEGEEETTVEEVTQFILERCVEDVDVIESYELQIYDMDIEDYVDFDFIDPDIFGKDGRTAKFKLNVTIDYDKKKKKEEMQQSELRELSEKSISIINLSEKQLSDSVQSLQKFDNSIDSSGIEMSSMEMSQLKVSENQEVSGIAMSGIEMSGIQISGVEMSGIQMSTFSQIHSISGKDALEMPSFVSVADNAPRVEQTENSLLGGSFEIPDSFKEPVATSQKDKKTKKIVNETYQILDKIESDDSVSDRKVYIAKDLGNKSGPNIVIKYLPIKSTTEFNRCMKEGVNMIRMGRTIQQKKIPLANIFDVFEEEDKEKNKASIRFLCFAMPYYGAGNLQNYLISDKNKKLDWTFVFSLFKQIVNALIYLHDQKIAHKNLKLSNIFFVDKENIVMTDYGLNSEISSQVPEHNSLSNVENIPIEKFQKADIYQAGLVFASLCSVMNGQSLTGLASIVKEGDNSLRNAFGPNVPEKAKDLICKMLRNEPTERPSIQQTLNLLDI